MFGTPERQLESQSTCSSADRADKDDIEDLDATGNEIVERWEIRRPKNVDPTVFPAQIEDLLKTH